MLDRDLIGRIPGIGKHLSMILNKGVYMGHRLERTVETLLAARGMRTFGDLPHGACGLSRPTSIMVEG